MRSAPRRAREQHRALQTRLAVLVRGVVLLRRRHLDERLAARVLHQRDRVPGVGVEVADQRLVDLAHPQHLAAARLDHLHDRAAVLVVLRRAFARLELQQVEHHDRTLVGRVHELDELFLVGRIPLMRAVPFGEFANEYRRRRAGRARRCSPARCAGGSTRPSSSTRSSASSVSRVEAGERRSSWRRRSRSSRARLRAIVGESWTESSAARRTGRDRLVERGALVDELLDGAPPARSDDANRCHCRCATSARSASTSAKWLCTERTETPARAATSGTLGRRMPGLVAGEQRVDDRLAVARPPRSPGRRPPSRRAVWH